ncbi:hypothetical protein [Nonomuraea indica]|uniref:hypothetical protein n=1 Tax=Nonomuraea indica TaxID=1581193 RepID=UPI000C7DDEFC|nr:hypothetical protein [Nonomuraea indica]
MADELKVPAQKPAGGPGGDDDLRVVVAKDDAPAHGSGHGDARDPSRAEAVRDRSEAGMHGGAHDRPEAGAAGSTQDRPEAGVAGGAHADVRGPSRDADDERARDPHAKDYKDPYTAPAEDVAVSAGPGPMVRGQETGAAGGMPSHAAPQETALFDRDPADVQARWRDLQAGFVDDPGDAVKRADGLVGEVVESLTSALNQRTSELRGRWQGAGGHDTEQLRQALREYRGVLERLLAVSAAGKGPDSTTSTSTRTDTSANTTQAGSPVSPGMR